MEHIRSYVKRVETALKNCNLQRIARILDLLYQTYNHGKKIFIMGNGGSAAIASHFATDLVKSTNLKDKKFRVISLTDNTPLLTALANDYGYHCVFSFQLDGLLDPGDLVVVISGSGRSPNIIAALEYAKAHGAITVGLLGMGDSRAADLADEYLIVNSGQYEVIEDIHSMLAHLFCDNLRKKITNEEV